jgi:primosomal protein N' (replication factor Y)
LNPFFIKVAIPLPVEGLFTYQVPQNFTGQIKIGIRVLVPFGRRIISAYVIENVTIPEDFKIKKIIDVLDHEALFPEEMVPFFFWISKYYFSPIGEVIKLALPKGLKIHDRMGLRITQSGHKVLSKGLAPENAQRLLSILDQHTQKAYIPKLEHTATPSATLINSLVKKGWVKKTRELTPQKAKAQMVQTIALVPEINKKKNFSNARQKIVDFLKLNGCVPMSMLKKIGPNAISLARKMEKDGQLEMTYERVFRDPFGKPIESDRPPTLTPEQIIAITRIKTTIGQKYQTYLLSGVTGSGKTEIYLQLADYTISCNLSVLILVPEIGLINQMERSFRSRFKNRVAILHSSLSKGQRFDQWEQIASGKIPICIGVRSAIFAPLKKVGLIVVDEEHDSSYKQEDRLRYNARDLAVVRGHQTNATVVLGSATPSIQSYYNVTIAKFIEIPLYHRIKNRPLPEIEFVDLSKDKEISGIRRFITPVLYKAIQTNLARGEQTLLFLNRRGFANLPICMDCKKILKCKNCDISLTLHRSINGFKCHFCGYSCSATTNCDHCGSTRIQSLGMGTEKIEATVKQLFPKAKVARLDRDTTVRKGSLLKILKDLKNGDIQILIGTQMVAKGHDFPNITLVGIICADLSLSFPDFRAGERTFQMIAQVAGRTGRGDRPGRVLLQSYQPNHFSIATAQSQNFRKFYAQEIPFRKALHYPPFSRLIQIRIVSQNEKQAASHAHRLAEICQRLKRDDPDLAEKIEVLGPIEAPLFRLAKYYRFQMILKCGQAGLLHQFTERLRLETLQEKKHNSVKVHLDVDPYFMM